MDEGFFVSGAVGDGGVGGLWGGKLLVVACAIVVDPWEEQGWMVKATYMPCSHLICCIWSVII